MTTEEQIAKLQTDLEKMRKLAQEHYVAWHQHLGAAAYVEGKIVELQAKAQKEPAKEPTK